LQIDALRSAASSTRSDATAEEGHVNYDVSDVTVEACAAPMMGSGWFGWVLAARRCVVELFFFVVARARSDGGAANPHRAREGRRRDVWSLGRGMGLLGCGVYLALSQGDSTDGEGHGSVVIVAIFGGGGSIFTPWGAPNYMLSRRSRTRK